MRITYLFQIMIIFQEGVDYPFFGVIIEVVDHPPLVKITFYLFI
jgi:hypothetical protein